LEVTVAFEPTFGRPGPQLGLYGISVAAELVDMAPQTLRSYESHGLVEPARTDGGTRRYSENDLNRLRHIGQLLAAGLNLAGVKVVLEMELENQRLRNELGDAQAELAQRPRPADGGGVTGASA
jgi:MerR family transcriptional regulator/heat shock protein HspR